MNLVKSKYRLILTEHHLKNLLVLATSSVNLKLYTIKFFTRLTSWESACKIIAQHGNISPLYPLPPSITLSLFLLSLRNKSKTKVFSVHLKTILEVVLRELKIWNFHQYVQKIMLFLQKHSHSLKLQFIFGRT